MMRVRPIRAMGAGSAGAPDGSVNWLTDISIEATQALMKHRDVAVILATGGMGLVRAAYSAGKPAYGVGPGNAPCFIERTADLAKAAGDILAPEAALPFYVRHRVALTEAERRAGAVLAAG